MVLRVTNTVGLSFAGETKKGVNYYDSKVKQYEENTRVKFLVKFNCFKPNRCICFHVLSSFLFLTKGYNTNGTIKRT